MTLYDLAAQYRESAELLRGRITELSDTLKTTPMSETEKLRLRIRVDTLRRLFRDTSLTAVRLERYYDRRRKPHVHTVSK